MTLLIEPAPAAVLEAQRAYVERVVGRPLRPAERHVDVLRLNRALNDAKDELTRAIRAEQRRAIRRSLRESRRVQLQVTNPMLDTLRRLVRLGQAEALAELRRAGYTTARRYAAPAEEPSPRDPVWPHYHKLRLLLGTLSYRVDREVLAADFTSAATSAVLAALYQVAGGRDAASRLVSGALDTGLAFTFERNQDLVDGWAITAILDGATCDPCAEHDGEEFATWDEISQLLPDGGPAVYCDGTDRCRCRAVPTGAG